MPLRDSITKIGFLVFILIAIGATSVAIEWTIFTTTAIRNSIACHFTVACGSTIALITTILSHIPHRRQYDRLY
jgi:hypothetical protein